MHKLLQSMFVTNPHILADYIWVGGGSLGLIVLIVVVVLVLRG
jgi:hypothetical protein